MASRGAQEHTRYPVYHRAGACGTEQRILASEAACEYTVCEGNQGQLAEAQREDAEDARGEVVLTGIVSRI